VASETNSLLAVANSYIDASNAGPSSSKDKTYRNRKSSVMKDDMQFDAHNGNQLQNRKSLKSINDARVDINNYNGAQQRDQQSPRPRRKSPSLSSAKENSSSSEEDRRKKKEDQRYYAS